MIETVSGKLFWFFEKNWQNFRKFFHRNDTLFDIVFLLIYFIEQLLLVYFILIFRENLEYLPYIPTFFALMLLTTVGIHRLVMESKNRFISEQKDEFISEYSKMEFKYNLLLNEYRQQNRIVKEISKDNETLYRENQKLRNK